MSSKLVNLVRLRSLHHLDEVVQELNEMRDALVTRFNSEFSPRYLGRQPSESIPTAPRQLSEFRTRLGLLIEYGLGLILAEFITDTEIYLSFVVNNQYPDFYIRSSEGQILLRINSKTLHDESAEYSARFKLLTTELRPDDDFTPLCSVAMAAWCLFGHR